MLPFVLLSIERASLLGTQSHGDGIPRQRPILDFEVVLVSHDDDAAVLPESGARHCSKLLERNSEASRTPNNAQEIDAIILCLAKP